LQTIAHHGLANGLDPVEMLGLNITALLACRHAVQRGTRSHEPGRRWVRDEATYLRSATKWQTHQAALGWICGMIGNHGENRLKPFGEEQSGLV